MSGGGVNPLAWRWLFFRFANFASMSKEIETPLLIVGGFLGAGKTTALRRCLPAFIAGGHKPAVILNDLENAQVDAQLLQDISDMVTPIDGSCMCCGDPAQLFDALRAISPEAGRLVVLEANGASDILGLLEMLALQPALSRFRPLRYFAVVDLEKWGERGPYSYLEADQIKAAVGLWVNRGGNLDEPTRVEKMRTIRELAPAAEYAEPEQWAAIVANLARPAFRILAPQRTHRRELHALAHSISAASVAISSYSSKKDVERWLDVLPENVLRVKGLLSRPPHHWVFQRVEGGFTHWEQLSFAPGLPDVAVVIGASLGEIPAPGETL